MDNNIFCYICYDKEEPNNKYLKDPYPCECKGSIVIHKKCLDNILKISRVCSICKTKYKVQYLPNINGLELITELNPNGDITEYTIDDKGNKHGEQIIKKQFGNIISQSYYLNGLLNGEYKTCYLNGQLECYCYCINNQIDGIFMSWYQNGQIMENSFYTNGLKNGSSIQWYSNGRIKYSNMYNNGIVI